MWGQASKTHLNKLLILQKRALRFIFLSDRRDRAIPLFLNAHILPINFMHYKLLAETMHDVSNDLVPSNLKDLCRFQNVRLYLLSFPPARDW